MRFRLLFVSALCLCLAGLGASPRVYADGNASLAKLRILVWPEYDDPRVLVQYEGDLAAGEALPREVSFFVPSRAELYATAYADDGGELVNTEPAKVQDVGDGFKRITLKLLKPRFHIEYYDNALPTSSDKTLDFVYKAAQPSASVRLEIQQPLKAEKFTTSPTATAQTSGYHDFKYHVFDYANVTTDQVVRVQVSYTKTDPNPSVANVPATNGTQPATTTAEASTSNLLVPVGIGAGTLALSALGFFAWNARRQPRVRATQSAPTRHGKKQGNARTVFCAQCGHTLDADDHFCANCGSMKRG